LVTMRGVQTVAPDVPCTDGYVAAQSENNCSEELVPGQKAWCQVYEATGVMQMSDSETNVYLIVCGVFLGIFAIIFVGGIVFILYVNCKCENQSGYGYQKVITHHLNNFKAAQSL